jgi:FixJ family two-component response regulator
MIDQESTAARPAVALVCGEPRLRRLLRLALEAGGYTVRDYPGLRDLAAPGTVAAAVVDLDSLRPRLVGRALHLRPPCLPETLPTVLISVYPAEVERPRAGPTDYLQPPFPADEIVRRVERLLRAAARRGVADRADGPLSPTR